jgi:adenylate kinase family enzyme
MSIFLLYFVPKLKLLTNSKLKLKSKKILIIGNSCAGKTTLAKEISQELGLHWVDLDEIHWLPDWKKRSEEEFISLIHSEILSHKEWIVSGNYHGIAQHNIWKENDTIIWLDYSLPVLIYRYFKRTFRRITTQEKCCNGNVESWRKTFFSRDNLLHYIIMIHRSRRKGFQYLKTEKHPDKKWIPIKKPSQLDLVELIDSLNS